MEDQKLKDTQSHVNRIFVFTIISWTLIIVLISAWNINDFKKQGAKMFLSQARSSFALIVTTRYWNSLHGGVYVPVTERTRPNPYLDTPARDLETKKGLLTLINPAFMTRQISELTQEKDRINFHITSPTPLNPANAPEPWEKTALGTFFSVNAEYYDWLEKEGKPSFRYMAPLWVTRPCLKCHSKQGYSEGDLRGGISVEIPTDQFLASQSNHIKHNLFAYLIIWTSVLLGVLIAFRIIKNEIKQKENLIDQLQSASNEVKTLKGFIPICASCKKIRDDKGYWSQLEKYIGERSDAEFTHGICPDCSKKIYQELGQV